MRSIYQEALGAQFGRLHPRIQARFGFSSQDSVASIGRGVMNRIWHGSPLLLPFLYIGTLRHIMFPEQGEAIPFEVANYAFQDGAGREVVSWVRTFTFPHRTRRFDAYMALAKDQHTIIDYFGTHCHYATDLHLSVTENGGIAIASGAHRFHLAGRAIPFPEWLAGQARVVEWFDDAADRYRISVRVTNPIVGLVMAYEGEFEAAWEEVTAVPAHILPARPIPA